MKCSRATWTRRMPISWRSALLVGLVAMFVLVAPARAAIIASIFPTSNVAPGDLVTIQGSGFVGPTTCNLQYNLKLECSAYVSPNPNQLWSSPTQFPALRCLYISSSTITVRVPHTSLGLNYLTILEAPKFTERLPISFTSSQTITISIPSSMKVYPFTGAPVPVAINQNVAFVKVSLWGAPGQPVPSGSTKGGVTEGVVAVDAGDTLTITVGGSNGYNGGGTTGLDGSACSAGGGATDLRRNGASLGHRIMVAGGGGGYGQSWAVYINQACGNSGHTFGIPNECCDRNMQHDGETWAGAGPPGGELDDHLDNVTFPYVNSEGSIKSAGGSGGSGTQSRGGTLRFGLSTPTGVAGTLGQGGQCVRQCITNLNQVCGSGGGGGGYYGGSGGPDCDGNGYGWFGGGGSGYVSNEIINGTASSKGGLMRPRESTLVIHGFAYVTEMPGAPMTAAVAPSTSAVAAPSTSAAPPPSTSAAAAPSTSASSLEHSKVVLKLTGSINTFGEGSSRRVAFVSGLAVVLRISENQIIFVSVTEGSVVVELGFVRMGGVHPSPADVVLRLKSAAASGELEQFGLIELTIGQESIFKVSSETSASVDVGVIVGASVGSVIGVILLMAVIWRWRRHRSQAREQESSKKSAIEMVVVSNTILASPFSIIPSSDVILDTSVAPQRGSFGEVFKCNWKGTLVALKKITSITDKRNFMQEAQMMHSIQHPNCVRLYGVCEAPVSAMVMEWMGGGDLLMFLAKRPLPAIHRRVSLFRQVCAGLNSLHSHSPAAIIHGDLKPANILLDSDQKVAKIADFGLSKIKTASYAGSNAVGTMLYFAPEMLLNEESSHRPTDIYSMGLIFWEMLTGKPVWHNSDGCPLKPFQLIAKYNKQERPSLDELPPGLDRAVIALMQDCWAEDPAQRPTADELWRRISALDPNNPEHNKPLQLYPGDFAPTCDTLEDCLRLAVPADVFTGLLQDMPTINLKYCDSNTQGVVRAHGLSEVEAKCIIMFTLESRHVPDHPRPLDRSRPNRDNQLYFLFNKACRERDAAAVQRFHNFSFHFVSALNKLPNFPLATGKSLYRGFGQRLEEMNDLYHSGGAVWWYYTSSSSLHCEKAYINFARESGTLVEITGVCNAKDIRALSMIPSEGELLILPNTEFKVKLALSCKEAHALNERYAKIPNNVDLVILEAVSVLPMAPAIHAFNGNVHSNHVKDSADLAALASLLALQAGYQGSASAGQSFTAV